MKRRQYLTAVAATGTMAIAGCGGDSGGGGTSGPTGAVQAYINAANNADSDALDAAVHADSPDRPLDGTLSGAQQFDYSLKSANTVDQSVPYSASDYDTVDEFQAVEAELKISGEMNGETIEQTQTSTVVVAKNTDGDWKFWTSMT